MIRYCIRASITVLACLVLAVSSCARDEPTTPPPPEAAGWPPSLEQFSFVWSAEPGVDLVTDGAAIATRAYVESYLLAQITEDNKYLYPGFGDATEPELRPEVGITEPSVYIGTVRHLLLSMSRSGSNVTLTGCAFTYGSAIEAEDGTYSAIVGDAFAPAPGIYPMRIALRAPDDTESKLPVQEGPSRAPFDNVFAGWKITSQQGGFLSTSRWPEYDRERAACVAKAAGAPGSERVYPHVPSSPSDFPTLPPTPGWPDKPAS